MARSWQLGPVLRGIRGHRAAALLVVLQLGIGLGITVLAVLIGDYFSGRNRVTLGFPEDDLTIVELQRPGRSTADADAPRRQAALLADLRATPGCVGAAVISRLPLHVLERVPDDVRADATAPAIAAYELEAGEGLAAASGLRLRAGRELVAADLDARAGVTAAVVSNSLARALWPDRDPVGARFLSRSHGPAVVVGVAEDMRSYVFGPEARAVVYARVAPSAPNTVVLVRNAPGRGTELRTALADRLGKLPGHHVVVMPVLEHARRAKGSVSSVLGILATIIATIVLVIFIGSMGLTYFLVAERTREIGLRRAMGATRRDVVVYFVVENLILTVAGVAIGVAIVMIALPTLFYEQTGFVVRWPLVALPVVAVVVLNLIATLIPARKAAAVPPVVASRSS